MMNGGRLSARGAYCIKRDKLQTTRVRDSVSVSEQSDDLPAASLLSKAIQPHADLLSGILPSKLPPHASHASSLTQLKQNSTNDRVLSRLKEEQRARLSLAAELMQAEQTIHESSFMIEALETELAKAQREKAVFEERSERLGTSLIMMESKAVKLATESQGLRDALQRAEASRDQAGEETANEIAGLETALLKERDMRTNLERRLSNVDSQLRGLDELRSQLREVSLDRGIVEGNLRGAVRQSLEMMRQRDEAKRLRDEAHLTAVERVKELSDELAVMSEAMEQLRLANEELSRREEAAER